MLDEISCSFCVQVELVILMPFIIALILLLQENLLALLSRKIH